MAWSVLWTIGEVLVWWSLASLAGAAVLAFALSRWKSPRSANIPRPALGARTRSVRTNAAAHGVPARAKEASRGRR